MRSIRASIVVALSFLFLAGPNLAQAEGITTRSIQDNWSKLTESQKASLAATIAEQAGENKVDAFGNVLPTDVKPGDVEEWFGLVDRVGDALVRLAKNLGITANELLVTPVGVIVTIWVTYHVMGKEVLEIFSALFWALIVFPALAVFFFKSVIPIHSYVEVKTKGWRGERTVYKPVRRHMVFGDSEGFNVDWIFILVAMVVLIIFVALLP